MICFLRNIHRTSCLPHQSIPILIPVKINHVNSPQTRHRIDILRRSLSSPNQSINSMIGKKKHKIKNRAKQSLRSSIILENGFPTENSFEIASVESSLLDLVGGDIGGEPCNNFDTHTSFQGNVVEAASGIPNAFVSETRSKNAISTTPTIRHTRFDQMRRSLLVLCSCVGTWIMVKQCGISTIQASSIHGIISCFIFTQVQYSAASFCGTFAGMSTQPRSIVEVTLLGMLCGMVYYSFENFQSLKGYGGRLGTIAFLSNVLYMILQSPTGFVSVLQNAIKIINPFSFLLIVLLWSASSYMTSSYESVREGKSNVTYRSNILDQSNLRQICKVVTLSLLIGRMISTSRANVPALELIKTALVVTTSSIISKKVPGLVLPVAVLGSLGSFLFPTYAAPIFMGAFIGMTSLIGYETINLIQASLSSACLLHLGIFDGVGGKLGFLALLGVYVGR